MDAHGGGRDAIALAKLLVAKSGELTLAHIYSGDPHVWRASDADHNTVERERTLELLERALEEAGIEAHLRACRSSSVGRGLHELCELIGADLLVVGSSRHELLGRVLIADDTRAALNGAPCAIAIAPTGYAEQPAAVREIGVGYNGSPESEHAVAVARRVAAEHGAKLSAFQAVSLPTYAFLQGGAPIAQAVDDLVDDARQRIAALGLDAHAVYGNPVEELALYSASLDLLIVGSRDYGPIGRLVHGSISHQLARRARCPLLVLTRAARAADAPESSDLKIGGTGPA